MTCADENGGIGESAEADRGTAVPRAASSLNRDVAAQERGSHLQNRILMKVPHDLFKFTTADDNDGLEEMWEPIVGPLSPERRPV